MMKVTWAFSERTKKDKRKKESVGFFMVFIVFNFKNSSKDQRESIKKGVELLKTTDLKSQWQKRRQKMLAETIDVTAFMVWFLENYPKSEETMLKDPEFQLRFKKR